MSVRKGIVRATLAAACLLPLVALGLWWIRPADPEGPSYEGRTLRQWLDESEQTPNGPTVLSSKAEAAVRALGPRAIPTLLVWLGQADSSIHKGAKVWLEWRFGLPVHVQLNQEKRVRAMYGFRALGMAARPAFPAIVHLVLHSPDEWQRGDAINSLTEADPDAMKLIVAGLKDPDKEIRLRAIHAIGCLRIAPDEVCYPALEEALNDPDIWVRGSAGKTIALLDDQLKAYIAGVKNPNGKWRAVCAQIVGGYRARARPYLADLEAAANEDDPELRAAALEAIRRIQVDAPSVE